MQERYPIQEDALERTSPNTARPMEPVRIQVKIVLIKPKVIRIWPPLKVKWKEARHVVNEGVSWV